MANPVLASHTATVDTTNLSHSVPPPSGLAQNDTWFIKVANDADNGDAFNTPAGFAAVTTTLFGVTSGWPIQREFWKIAGASETNVTITSTGASNYDGWSDSMRITGAHLTSPIDTFASVNPSGAGNTLTCPAVTIAQNESLVLGLMSAEGGSAFSSIAIPGSSTLIAEKVGTNQFPICSDAWVNANAGSFSMGDFVVTRDDTDAQDGLIRVVVIKPPGAGGGSDGPATGFRSLLGVGK